MSLAIKISNIRQAELAVNRLSDRMNASERVVNRKIDEAIAKARGVAERAAREEAERARREFDRKLERGLEGVYGNMQILDRNQRERLARVAADIRSEISKESNALRGEISQVNHKIEVLERNVDRRLAGQQAQIDTITDAVTGILEGIADRQKRRKEAIDLARGAYRSAFDAVEIDRFCPKEADEIRRRLEALAANPDDEATVSRSAEAIFQIQSAAEEATRRKVIYDALRGQAIENVLAVLGEVSDNRVVKVANPEDPSDVAEIETDFWSRGEYSSIEKRLSALKKELDSEPSTERVKEILAETECLQKRAEDLMRDAARQAILSENRVTVTEDIVTALINQGWQLERRADGSDAVDYIGGETDSDWREGVFAIINSVHGDRISIVVEPDESGLENRLIFHRNDQRKLSEAEYMETVRRICKQISQSGHKIDAPHAPADGGDVRIPELSNADGLSRSGTSDAIKRRTR